MTLGRAVWQRIARSRCRTVNVAELLQSLAKMMKATVTGGLHHVESTGIFGSDGRDRTYDQLINSQLLYR